jgi:uncharacterized protein YdhG (YjbR/CyaY superfamily)
MKSTDPSDIDAYIAAFPPEVQKSLQKIRALIREAAPDAVEALKYRIPTFVLGSNLVHFAAYQNHIGFYPTPSTITAFASELRDFVSAKGSVQFPLNRPIPFSLIRRMVEFRVSEVRAKKKPSRQAVKSTGLPVFKVTADSGIIPSSRARKLLG